MSKCPHCQALIPAPKPGASRPLNFCQACGKSLSVGLGAVKNSPAKTLMWSGGPIPGLPVKPAAPSPDAKPVLAADPAPAPASAEVKRRTATSDIGIAPTIVPPEPEFMPVSPRAPQKTVIGSGASLPIPGVVSPPVPADVDVSMQEAPVAAEPAAPAGPSAGVESSGPRVVDESVPEWADAPPSAGTGTEVLDSPGKGPNKLLIAGLAGGGLVVIAVVAGLLMGGKPSPAKPQAAAPVPAAEPAKPVALPIPVKPAPVAAEPAKPAEPEAEEPPENVAPPTEKPVAAAKPAEVLMPAADKAKVEKKPATVAQGAKPAPAAASERTRVAGEPPPEKKAAEAAAPAGEDKAQLAAEAFQRGNAKLLSGALPEAIAAFSEAIKLNPKDAQSQRGLGLAYAQAGKAPQAVRHLKLYLKAAPGAPDRALTEKRIAQLSGR